MKPIGQSPLIFHELENQMVSMKNRTCLSQANFSSLILRPRPSAHRDLKLQLLCTLFQQPVAMASSAPATSAPTLLLSSLNSALASRNTRLEFALRGILASPRAERRTLRAPPPALPPTLSRPRPSTARRPQGSAQPGQPPPAGQPLVVGPGTPSLPRDP